MGNRETINTRVLKSNMAFALISQIISFFISIFMVLVVPKFLNLLDYGYWQLFIFYVGYIGFFHFGLNDGLYLKLGGVEYEAMDYGRIGSQLKVSMLSQALFGGLIILSAGFLIGDSDRIYIIVASVVYMVIGNAASFMGFIFQAANRTKIFSIAEMIMKLSFLLMLAALLLFRVYRFEVFIICYLLALMISASYYCYHGRKLIFAVFSGFRTTVWEIWGNIGVGSKLLIANLAGMLILGSGRLVIERLWGIENFGQVSFSLSIANFFLMFMYQLGMVLFPALRQTDDLAQKRYYGEISDILSVLLPLILVFYIPLKMLLLLWLPQYAAGLDYLGILLPLCLFDGKMQLLAATYFKVLRKERALLFVNVAACALSLLLCLLGGFWLKSIDAIVFAMLTAVIFRYVISALYLSRLMPGQCWRALLGEIALSVFFVAVSLKLPPLWAFLLVFTGYLLYLLINGTQTKTVWLRLIRSIRS